MSARGCCGVRCLESFLIIYNIILFLTFLSVLGLGGWIFYTTYYYIPLLPYVTYPILLYALLASAILIFLALLLGCCGVCYKNPILILIYIFILSFILLLGATIGISSYIYKESVYDDLETNLNETFLTQYKQKEATTVAIDHVQETLKCCGADRVDDWKLSVWYQSSNSINQIVPDSCCKTVSVGCATVSDRPSNINISGCLIKLAQSLTDCLCMICLMGLGVSAVQIFGVIAGICLYIKLKTGDYEVETNRLLKPSNNYE